MSEKLSITLPREMVAAIKERVSSGRYASTSEVLREAMRLWMREEEERSQRLAAVRARIALSLADPRPALPIDDAFDRVQAHTDRLLGTR